MSDRDTSGFCKKAAQATKYMVEQGLENTESGNYHFEFDEIEKKFGVVVDEPFIRSVIDIAYCEYGNFIADLDFTEDFDFMFYTDYCQNYVEEEVKRK